MDMHLGEGPSNVADEKLTKMGARLVTEAINATLDLGQAWINDLRLLVGDREVQQGRLRGRPPPVEAGTPGREERSVSEPHHSEDEIGATGFAAIGLGMAVVGMVAARWAGGK